MDTGNLNVIPKLTAPVINTIQQNVVLNAFRIAVNGSLTQFNMIDGIVDEYEDESGINTGSSTNESYDTTNDLYSPFADNITTSPFAHMKLEDNTDEGTGANAVTNIGTPTYTSGKLNNALTLDGSTDALNLDALESDVGTDTSGSITGWFNIGTISGTQSIFCFGDTDAELYLRIAIDDSGKFRAIYIDGSADWAHTGSATLFASTWYHFAVVQDGVSPKIYIDGVDTTNLTITIDTTSWVGTSANFDNARLGCQNQNSAGNTNFFNGQIDDFRYYQNKALIQSEINAIYNAGTGSEDDQPTADAVENMTLISDSFTAEAEADNARIVIFEEDVDSITLNTDLLAYASRDGGTTFTQITLVNEGEYESGRNILSASVDISGQPTGTSMQYKLVTANKKDLKIHGTGLSWN